MGNNNSADKKISVEVVSLKELSPILILGPSGSGKSSILNMLFNDGYAPDQVRLPAGPVKPLEEANKSGRSFDQTVQIHINSKTKYAYCETSGLFNIETGSNEKETLDRVLAELKAALDFMIQGGGLSCLILVLPVQRQDDAIWKAIKAIGHFFQSNWKSQTVLCLTQVESISRHTGKNRDDPDFQKKFIKYLDDEWWTTKSPPPEKGKRISSLQGFGLVVPCYNRLDKQKVHGKEIDHVVESEAHRKHCHTMLTRFIRGCKSRIYLDETKTNGPKPLTFLIWEFFVGLFSDKKKHHYFGQYLQNDVPANPQKLIFEGKCSSCGKALKEIGSITFLSCGHSLHNTCQKCPCMKR